jgi:ClpP class serine protease
MSLQNHSIWQIDEAYLPTLMARLKGSERPGLPTLPEQYLKVAQNDLARAWNTYLTERYSTDNRVLVLPISGPMSRDSYWSLGNEMLMRLLASAADDPKYLGVVMSMNTPGGTADSTLALAQSVEAFRKKKPIMTATAYCASAGYFAASPSTEIFIEDQAASAIGSIGTLLIYENRTKQLEQDGISMEIMRAKGSQDKARANWIEPLPDSARAELQAMLDDCQKEFAGMVKRSRAGKIKSDEVLTGKMYGADAAIRYGLADRKGTLADAIKRVIQLSNSK